jgi:hypothetical protein
VAKTLKKINAGSPLVTNAHCNRTAAERAFRAGVTMLQIAEFWPEVWRVTTEHGKQVIGQKYDYELADGSGRKETNRRITADSVTACIERYTK